MSAVNGTFSYPTLSPEHSFILEWYDVLSFLVAFIGIVGNSFVIYLVKTRSSLKDTSNTFVLSLAVADLLVSVIIQPSKFACAFSPDNCNVQLQRIFSELFIYWSVYSLCGLTIERYVSIVYPMKRSTFMSKTRVTLCILLCWLIPLVNFGLHFPWFYSSSIETRKFWLKTFTAIETCTMVGIPAIILVVLYARIFFVAQRIRKLTAHQIGMVNYNKDLKNSVGTNNIQKSGAREENEVAGKAGSSVQRKAYEKDEENGVRKMSIDETRFLRNDRNVELEIKELGKCQKSCYKEQSPRSHFQASSSLDTEVTYDDNGLELSLDETNLTIQTNHAGTENGFELPDIKETLKTNSSRFCRGFWSSNPVLYNTHTRMKTSKRSIKERLEQLLTIKQKRSGVSMIGCVIAIFLICWGVALYCSFCYYFAHCSVSYSTRRFSWILLLLNSAVNPIVYALLKLDMRAEFVRLLRSWINRLANLKRDIKINPMSPKQLNNI